MVLKKTLLYEMLIQTLSVLVTYLKEYFMKNI